MDVSSESELSFRPFPEEQVVSIEEFPAHIPDKHLSCLRAIMRLTMADSPQEIGHHGPSIAADAINREAADEHLKLYDVFFPRDAFVVSQFLADRYPALVKATVLEALKYTGVRDNLRSDGLLDEQELGKIPHEIRDPASDAIAQRLIAEKNWGWPYYGAVDTTGKNINVICNYVLTHNDPSFLSDTYMGLDGQTHTVAEGLTANINWIRKRMDLNPEGLIEALWMNPRHHANQTWADSPDAFHHADGSWPAFYPDRNWGVAGIELQAETYDALMNSVKLYEQLFNTATPERQAYLQQEIQDLYSRASKLKTTILNHFWVEDPKRHGGFFARGTDRDENGRLQPMAIRSSDMGHVLNSQLLVGEEPEIVYKREAVIRNLFSAEMLCPSGVRTLASDELRYFEDRYHDGNSWPWVTYYIAQGLGRHGYYGLAQELKQRAWSVYNETKILPEYASGSSDPSKRLITKKVTIHDPTIVAEPTHAISQPPQEVQAWTAAAILAIKYENGRRLRDKTAPARATNPERRQLEDAVLATL